MMEQMAKKISLREEILGEIKETLPKHENNEFLEEVSEVARETRKKELEEVEKAIIQGENNKK
jgi:hypothetical protein